VREIRVTEIKRRERNKDTNRKKEASAIKPVPGMADIINEFKLRKKNTIHHPTSTPTKPTNK
jgi:hypothetical protein